MRAVYIGIDNGVTGAVGVVASHAADLAPIPTISQQSYTKAKAHITRVDHVALLELLRDIISEGAGSNIRAFIERPFTGGPKAFKATVSGMRCLESVLIAIERFSLPYQYVDSREWQKAMLPKGLKGAAELKPASRDIGMRLFPMLEEQITKQKDADALLIAEWARRNQL
jgi:hypothetical protein